MTVTIKDIARMAGVSHTTVSRALNNSPLINAATKLKIRSLASEHNYIPNFHAKSLVLDRSYNLGLFFSTLNTGTSADFFYEAVRAVNSVVKDAYKLIVKGIDDYKQFHSIHRKGFDGILIVSQTPEDDPFIDHLLQAKIPFVVVNRSVDKPGVSNVVSDDRNGARLITEHLVRSGHRKIALIEGKAGFQSTLERRAGFIDALEAEQAVFLSRYTAKGDYTLESGYQAMCRLLDQEDRPTAVFCMNDDMATGAMKAIANAGLRVPDDISVAGFDDSHFSAFVTPALSTVRRPIDKICSRAAQLLLEQIDKKTMAPETVYLHTELVIRDSIQAIFSTKE